MTLGAALNNYFTLRGTLPDLEKDLLPKHARELHAVCDNRDDMFVTVWACASYLLDPRHRGVLLSTARRRQTIEFCLKTAWPAVCGQLPPPSLTDFMEFIEQRGM